MAYALIVAVSVVFLISGSGLAQNPDDLKSLKRDVEELKAGQKSILKEFGEIKRLLRGRRPASRQRVQTVDISMDVGQEPFKGKADAKLTLVEFSDYECPFCARHFTRTMPQLEKEYIATGKVKYVLMDFPIESIHRKAFKAHEAALCAVHDRIFNNRKAMAPQDLVKHAETVGLDMGKFRECFESDKHASEIRQDIAEGRKAGVRGTPTFFVGVTDPKSSKVKLVRLIRGAQSFSTFKSVMDGLLKEKK
jgi:protein-disulfide isomerase